MEQKKARLHFDQNGFAPIFVIMGILAFCLAIGGSYFLTQEPAQKQVDAAPAPQESQESAPVEQVSPSPNFQVSIKPIPVVTVSPTPARSAKASETSKPTATPTSNPTTPQATPTPQALPYANCEVHTSQASGLEPLKVDLIYGMAAYNTQGVSGWENVYVTRVQWDWNGDGVWDTPYDTSVQHISHTFDTPGTYNLRMHLQLNNGYETSICTGSITIQ